jgi:SpoVK/Ycf46/Vps4 family AAA+-type ATPase
VLLYGEPGNGKSQFINYISQNFSLTQCCLYTSPNGSGFTLISSPHTGKSILAIEDYDSIFNGRENISQTLKGDFSQLLKLIDDFEGLVFITTNKLESIDPAIGIPVDGKSTRPGRIHRIIKMGPPSEKVRTDIANNILYGYPDKIADIVKEGEGESYAQFTDRCTTLALDLYWKLPV